MSLRLSSSVRVPFLPVAKMSQMCRLLRRLERVVARRRCCSFLFLRRVVPSVVQVILRARRVVEPAWGGGFGAVLGRSWAILAPSCVWKPLWPFLAGPGRAKMEPRWAQWAPRWAKLGPRWRDLAAKRRQEAPRRGYLAPCWELLGQSGEHFSHILPKRLESKKPQKP